MDNSKWFDIKLLVDTHGDLTHEMKNDGYSKHIKRVMQKLQLVCDILCHLGRKMGAKMLELLEEETEELKKMGQWNPSCFDAAYSTKLPLGAIRKLAGFVSANKLYFNTRTTVEPPDELLRKTPIGVWAIDAQQNLLEARGTSDSKCQTALHFLKFMAMLNRVFIQDSAAMMVLHSEREIHPVFESFECFRTPEFMVSTSRSANIYDMFPLFLTLFLARPHRLSRKQ
jgi:hypothetical protein